MGGILCLALVSGMLGGCGKNGGGSAGANGQEEETAKGRYVETQVDLPEQLEGWNIRQLFAAEDGIHLLAARQEEYKSHLWKGSGDAAQEITPQKWTIPNEEWGGYETVLGVAAMNDNTLTAVSYTSMDRLDGASGSILESEAVYDIYDNIVTNGESLYLGSGYGSGTSGLEIEKRRGAQSRTFTFQENMTGAPYCVLKDGTLIAAGQEGIFRGVENPDMQEGIAWEKLMDGAETDFALAQCWCTGLAALEDGRIYALFQESGGGVKLKKYEYDPEAVITVTENLKLYTVYANSLLEQAAAMYHREHPQVMITIQSVYPMYYYDEPDYNAVYQELNTLLMGIITDNEKKTVDFLPVKC